MTPRVSTLRDEAGMRCGEMIALEWTDVDFNTRQLCIRRSDWNGHVTSPKGGRLRHVPMTRRLAAALSDHRHLRSPRVLCQDDRSLWVSNSSSSGSDWELDEVPTVGDPLAPKDLDGVVKL
jgi:integrase